MPLTSSRDFQRVLATGSHVRSGGLTVVQVSSESDRARFGLVAGKRVGKAVARNRAKRRLRHVVRQVSLEPATDYVLIAGPEVLIADFSTLRRWLESAIGGDGDA